MVRTPAERGVFSTGAENPMELPSVPQERSLMSLMSSGVRVHTPIMRRQGHSPDVSWTIKLDSAVQQILGIDIDNSRFGELIGQIHVNRDSRFGRQRDRSRNQRSMKTHKDGFAVRTSDSSRHLLPPPQLSASGGHECFFGTPEMSLSKALATRIHVAKRD